MTGGGYVYNGGICAGLTVEGCNKLKRDRACDAECQRARKPLKDLWDRKDANVQDSILLLAMIQGLVGAPGYASISGNALLTIISIALSIKGFYYLLSNAQGSLLTSLSVSAITGDRRVIELRSNHRRSIR